LEIIIFESLAGVSSWNDIQPVDCETDGTEYSHAQDHGFSQDCQNKAQSGAETG
jgi:hypothetical protein